jgi:hypothetical protein
MFPQDDSPSVRQVEDRQQIILQHRFASSVLCLGNKA